MVLKSVSLLGLPVELICHILCYLELHDLLHCSRVNKCLRKTIQGSSRLQYTVELATHRLVSTQPTSTGLPLSARLKLLRDRERSWKNLSWRNSYTLDLPPTGSVYEFVGGFYGNGREDDRRVAPSISFFQLPSAEDGEDETQEEAEEGERFHEMKWTHTMLDLAIIDFTMDPVQDLLVLVAAAPTESKYVYQLHLRTLSTNEPHPKAPAATLGSVAKTVGADEPTGASVRVQVAGHLVALLVKEVLDTSGAHLEIWNWHCGPQHSVFHQCRMMKITGIDDFCFLSHDTYLLVRPSGKFEVCSFPNPGNSSELPKTRASYAFPPLAPGYMYWYISMSCNPAAGYLPSHFTTPGDGDSLTENPLFYPRPDERIHACCLYVFNPTRVGDHVHSFVFFVNIRTFLHPELYVSPVSDGQTPAVIPWESWGPHNTRWFPERLSTDWQHALYGYRTVETLPNSADVQPRRLRVRDYNPYTVALALRDQADEERYEDEDEGRSRIVTEASTVLARGAFEHDVVSSLPYREVVSEETFDVTDVMMDDCRVLLLKRANSGQLCGIDVLTIG